MTVSFVDAIDIAAPMDEVYRWVSDEAYSTLWDGTTVSRSPGLTVRRRGAELKQTSERLHFQPPLTFAQELDIEGEHELVQFDLAPIVNGTRLTVTTSMFNPSAKLRRQAEKNSDRFRAIIHAELEQIKTLAERGQVPGPITPISDVNVTSRLSKMSPEGRSLWENASDGARERAAYAVSLGANATNAIEARLAVEYATAIKKDFTATAIAKTVGLALLSVAMLVYAVLFERAVVGALSIFFLFVDARSLIARRRVQGTIDAALDANRSFLEQSHSVESAISRMATADESQRVTIIDELAAADCVNSLNRRIEVALERLAAHSSPPVASRAIAALAQRRARISELLQAQGPQPASLQAPLHQAA